MSHYYCHAAKTDFFLLHSTLDEIERPGSLETDGMPFCSGVYVNR